MRFATTFILVCLGLAVIFLISMVGFVIEPMAFWPKLGLMVSVNIFTVGGTFLGCLTLLCTMLSPCHVGRSIMQIVRS